MQSDNFSVFKDIRSDAIEKHLAVSLWLEMSKLIFKRFTTAIGSPIVACLSRSIALVARFDIIIIIIIIIIIYILLLLYIILFFIYYINSRVLFMKDLDDYYL